jgi:hypothetical protein
MDIPLAANRTVLQQSDSCPGVEAHASLQKQPGALKDTAKQVFLFGDVEPPPI